MKFGIVILLILGLIAAACAALLMGTLSIGPSASGKTPANIEVAVANASLPAMTIMTNDYIDTETFSRHELPKGTLVRPTQVIGRVLAVPVVEGQILTESCFVPSGTASEIIGQIPNGMRAYTVHVSSKGMPDRALLYPGCVVDVLVAYRLSSRDADGDALSTTMLRGVQVLGISGDLVAANQEGEEEKGAQKRDTSQGEASVTLLVDTKQAEALQLAQENGTITLSIRNPVDKKEFDEDPTVLKKGKLTTGGTDLTASVKKESPEEGPVQSVQQPTSNNLQQNSTANGVGDPNVPVPQPSREIKSNNRRNQPIEITVIRGPKKTVEEFENPENKP
jgi:pilus assembly protein CpaB